MLKLNFIQSSVSSGSGGDYSLPAMASTDLAGCVDHATPAIAAQDSTALLSVLVPVHNEAPTLERLLRQVRATLPMAQVIAVDDGSTDDSAEILLRLASELGLLVLSTGGRVEQGRLRGRGKGFAVRLAASHADRDFLIIQDADLEYDPADIHSLLASAGPATVAVYGSRYLSRGRASGGARANYLATVFMSWCICCRYRRRITDPFTCYKLVRRDRFASMELRSDGFEICSEITASLLRSGEAILEVPIAYVPRCKAEGKKIRAWHMIPALRAALFASRR